MTLHKSAVWSGLLLVAALLQASCTTVVTRPDPAANLKKYHRFFIQHRLIDNHFVDEYLVRELEREGFEAAAGPMTMKPDNADAIVTYEDHWEWDFWSYLIELKLEIYDARTDKPIAKCRYYQPAISTRGPAEICHVLLAPLFGPVAPKQ